MGKRVLVHSPSILCRTWHSINDAKDERISTVSVPEQSSQSVSMLKEFGVCFLTTEEKMPLMLFEMNSDQNSS